MFRNNKEYTAKGLFTCNSFVQPVVCDKEMVLYTSDIHSQTQKGCLQHFSCPAQGDDNKLPDICEQALSLHSAGQCMVTELITETDLMV